MLSLNAFDEFTSMLRLNLPNVVAFTIQLTGLNVPFVTVPISCVLLVLFLLCLFLLRLLVCLV